jgi:hypothetical protein
MLTGRQLQAASQPASKPASQQASKQAWPDTKAPAKPQVHQLVNQQDVQTISPLTTLPLPSQLRLSFS